jgi:hypothetical protein
MTRSPNASGHLRGHECRVSLSLAADRGGCCLPEPFLRLVECPLAFTDQAAPGLSAKAGPLPVDRLGQADPWWQA